MLIILLNECKVSKKNSPRLAEMPQNQIGQEALVYFIGFKAIILSKKIKNYVSVSI
jgi:hypothetical protein